MNYSDYDSDGYSSNEDADYVPSDGSLSEDDINECEKEDPLHEDEEVPHPGSVHKSKKKKKDKNLSRKRKKGIFKVENADKDQVEETNQPPNEEPPAQLQQEEDEAKQKKKSDDLWASFLFDVGSRPKLSTAATDSDTTSKRDTQTSTVKVASPKAETKPSEPEKVTITKVFDFAGEEVRVNEEVAADSQEARRFLKSQSSPQENKETEEECSSPSPSSVTVSSGVKRPAGLSKILGRIGGKKQKMSTLEKSKMDWDAFKSEEGISEELAIHNRGREGYVERKNFLERVDHRQFEIEKTVRLSNMKR